MRYKTLAVGVLSLITMLSLFGCAGKIRYPSYYALEVPTPSASSSPSDPILSSVAVREFRAPTYLKEGPIVFRPSSEQIDFYDYHRWAEDPRRVATQAVVQQIRARGLSKSVDLFDGRGSAEFLVTGTLDRLEEVDNGRAVSTEVTLSAQLTNLRTGVVVWQDTATETAMLDKRSVESVVSELSQGLGAAVSTLVSSMQERLSTPSSSLSKSAGE